MLVQSGDRVESGQEMAVLESMKMEIPVTAEAAGRVKKVIKQEGEFVQEGDTLFILETD